jgi:hypothetical protein
MLRLYAFSKSKKHLLDVPSLDLVVRHTDSITNKPEVLSSIRQQLKYRPGSWSHTGMSSLPLTPPLRPFPPSQ